MNNRIFNRLGRRGIFLLFLAMLDLIYGFALAFPTNQAVQNPTYTFLAKVMPLGIWAALWAFAGLMCLVSAFRNRDAPGYAAAIGIKTLWALIFLLGWLFADVERGYLSFAIWGAFAAVTGLIATWPEEAGLGLKGK